jgi:hypothetical protein
MSRQFTLDQLAEGIRERHLGTENKRLIEKWNRTGLLRGLEGVTKENMARLLENQTAQILREANSLGAGGGSVSVGGPSDIRGFTNIAFPIVRRVFGGLVANELVSIQPMSLPSGLLFYLDYSYGANRGGNSGIDGDSGGSAATYVTGTSIYGNPLGKNIQAGASAAGGMYDLAGSGFSRVHVSSTVTLTSTGSYGNSGVWGDQALVTTGTDGRLTGFDPGLANLVDAGGAYHFAVVPLSGLTDADTTMVKEFALHKSNSAAPTKLSVIPATVQGGQNILNIRRLNQLGIWDNVAKTFTPSPLVAVSTSGASVLMVVSGNPVGVGANEASLAVSYAQSSALDLTEGTGSTLTIPSFESNFGVEPSPAIPEIDIKIESLAVTAQTRKLRARWSPELAQDLNAYHSMDAEVELTQILSEQIALELDREILNDLLTQASGANYYWSRAPGKFVNKTSGAEIVRGTNIPGPAFTGTVREWYETLVETVIDVANEIHRKTLRGSANFIVVSPDVATILEASVLYKPVYSIDGSGQVGAPFSIGAEKIGTLSNRFTVYKDPYFPRNKVLVGFKGGSYLETGYVYAPYVPLIVTPTIFAPEDFTPRKGVMTRYGKKMVRADFYGTVSILDLNII